MCNKVCYSEREAHTIINAAKKYNHYSHQKKIPKRAYYCKECRAWHVTSKSFKGGYDFS
jgi:hypothetical protein